MIKLLLIFFIFSQTFSSGFCQTQPTNVAESTFKLGALDSKELFYGFMEGDQLIFSFEEINGKELKEIEISEYPSSSKFMDYKTSKITRMLAIHKTGVYKFRFKNTAISGRICKYKIQRVPASDLAKKFNSSVYWRSINDTTFFMMKVKKQKSRNNHIVPIITHTIERVHSRTSMNGLPNRSYINFTIPANTISWSYYIGVGESSEAIFRHAEAKAKRTKQQLKSASSLVNTLSTVDPSGSAVMASLALNGYAEFGVNEKADNIQYWITDKQNMQLFMTGSEFSMYEKGNGPLYHKQISSLKGNLYFCLLNDNLMEGIDVHIRVSAVLSNEQLIKKYKVSSRKEPYIEAYSVSMK